jgi:hypothetical protein
VGRKVGRIVGQVGRIGIPTTTEMAAGERDVLLERLSAHDIPRPSLKPSATAARLV